MPGGDYKHFWISGSLYCERRIISTALIRGNNGFFRPRASSASIRLRGRTESRPDTMRGRNLAMRPIGLYTPVGMGRRYRVTPRLDAEMAGRYQKVCGASDSGAILKDNVTRISLTLVNEHLRGIPVDF